MHLSVLGKEIIDFLVRENRSAQFPRMVLEGTVGLGGHSEMLLEADQNVHLFGFDRDEKALTAARTRLKRFSDRVHLMHGNFADCIELFSRYQALVGVGGFSAVLIDLGISSAQLDDAERGFSFLREGPLDMRMDSRSPKAADQIVNDYSPRELELVFKKGGLGPDSRSLARAIVNSRPIESTSQLANLCESVLRPRMRRRGSEKQHHPATVPFQAIRIEVNQELESLSRFLEIAPQLLCDRGRLGIISFHSLEDRVVTRSMRHWERGEDVPRELRVANNASSLGKLLTKQAIVPGEEEVAKNPRARSARLRVFERIVNPNVNNFKRGAEAVQI